MKIYIFKIIERSKIQEFHTNRLLTDQELNKLDGIRWFYANVLASTEEEAWDRLDQYFVYWPSSKEIDPELLMIV